MKDHPTPEQLRCLWNKHTDGIPFSTVCVLNKKRFANSSLRLKEKASLDYWRCLFDALKLIPEFCGDNEKRFIVSFDWIIRNDKNHTIIYDGIQKENKRRLAENFKCKLERGELDYLKQYLGPEKKVEELPHFVTLIPNFNGKINKEVVEWAYRALSNWKKKD